MKNVRILISLSALLFGVSVVGISLVSAAQVQSQSLDVSEKEMYFDQELLPDHVLYPVAMAKDRIMLELAQPEDRIALRMKYAERRLRAVPILLEKGKTETALSTATKSQKYLLSAVLEARSMELNDSLLREVTEALQKQTAELYELQTKFPEQKQSVLEALLVQSQASF